MTGQKVIRNHHCAAPEDRVVAWACACCERCWLFVAGRHMGTCPYGGPFAGHSDDADAPPRVR